MNYSINLLDDIVVGKTKTRRIVVTHKVENKKHNGKDRTLKLNTVEYFYNQILKDGKFKPRDVCIRCQDPIGNTYTAKAYNSDIIRLSNEYASDRGVDNPAKFDCVTKATFYIMMKN